MTKAEGRNKIRDVYVHDSDAATMADFEMRVRYEVGCKLGTEAVERAFGDPSVLPDTPALRWKALARIADAMLLINPVDNLNIRPILDESSGVIKTSDVETRTMQELEAFVDKMSFYVDADEPISGDSEEYLKYIFGDISPLDLKVGSIPATIKAMLEISDGLGDKAKNHTDLILSLGLMLQGMTPKEISDIIGVKVGEIKTKLRTYRFRTVRKATQNKLSKKELRDILEKHMTSIEQKHKPDEIEQEEIIWLRDENEEAVLNEPYPINSDPIYSPIEVPRRYLRSLSDLEVPDSDLR